jgi:sulfofructose kinase
MSNKHYFDVLGLGSVTVDFVGKVKSWPAEGTKLPLQSFSIHDGGLVATALVAVARLGGGACFAGKLGYSEMANRAVSALSKDSVDTLFVIRTENAEPIIAFVFTNTFNGQRNIFWTRNNVQYPLPSEFPVQDWYKTTKVLLVDGESGSVGIQAAKVCGQHGIPVVVDVEKNEPHAGELMAVSTHVIVSQDFAAEYTGKKDIKQMLAALKTMPGQTIIITRGENGCVGLAPDGSFELPAFKVKVEDTTGCGDVFHGAYALALARNQIPLEAARFASAAAALCATKLGGRDGIPTAEQLQSFIDA